MREMQEKRRLLKIMKMRRPSLNVKAKPLSEENTIKIV
jgi:hypothetical protein